MNPYYRDEPQPIGAVLATLASNPLAGRESVGIGERWPVLRTGQREPISRLTRRLIYLRDEHRCCFCDQRGLLELDHIVPWSAGGPDDSENLRSLCGRCNGERSNYRTIADTLAIPVTLACDHCITHWIKHFGVARYGRCIPDAPAVTAFCGTCQGYGAVTDQSRLR